MHFHRLIRNRRNSDLYAVLDDRANRRALLMAWWPCEDLHGVKVVSEYAYQDHTDRARALLTAVDHGKGMAR